MGGGGIHGVVRERARECARMGVCARETAVPGDGNSVIYLHIPRWNLGSGDRFYMMRMGCARSNPICVDDFDDVFLLPACRFESANIDMMPMSQVIKGNNVVRRGSHGQERRHSVRVVAMSREGSIAGRRATLCSVLSIPVLSMVMQGNIPAKALIPDDDDEEMIEKAKANRRNRLAGERKAEKAFSRTEGFVDKNTKKDIVSVQLAVNSLAKVGDALSKGDVAAASSELSGSWASKFVSVAASLSINDDTKVAADKLIAEIDALRAAAAAGSLADAKKEYVDAVNSLVGWTRLAELSGLKGI